MGDVLWALMNSLTLLLIVLFCSPSIFRIKGKEHKKADIVVNWGGLATAIFIWVLVMGYFWIDLIFE